MNGSVFFGCGAAAAQIRSRFPRAGRVRPGRDPPARGTASLAPVRRKRAFSCRRRDQRGGSRPRAGKGDGSFALQRGRGDAAGLFLRRRAAHRHLRPGDRGRSWAWLCKLLLAVHPSGAGTPRDLRRSGGQAVRRPLRQYPDRRPAGRRKNDGAARADPHACGQRAAHGRDRRAGGTLRRRFRSRT